MNSGVSGHYPCPVQFFQHVDFPSVPSYSDLAGLNVPQTCSVSHHLTPPSNSCSINHTRSSMSVYSPNRSLSDHCMPSTSALTDPPSVHGLAGNFLHFQHLPNQMMFRENACHSASNRRHHFSKSPWYSNQPVDETSSVNEPSTYTAIKPEKDQKLIKDQKEKTKRVRYIKPGCSDLCRRCCKQKISQHMREDLFNKYWNLKDDAKKRAFIAQNAIKMPMMKCKEGSRRSFSVDWAFSVKGESFSVCKLFFLHTLDIPENTAYAAIKDGQFFNSDKPVITGRVQDKGKSKTTWFETDIDDCSFSERKGKYSRESRYESFTKNDRFTKMGPGCSKLCRRNCQSKFSQEERLTVFHEYRSLSNIRKQREYISKYINRMERKRIRAGESTRRGCSIQWNLPSKGKEIPVCKTFFLHTVGISERAAYNIGLQNQIQPVERGAKRSRTNRSMFLGQSRSLGSNIAKEKLKTAIRMSRRKKTVVKSVKGDSADECYVDSQKQNTTKGVRRGKASKHKRWRKRKLCDKTIQFTKREVDNVQEEKNRNKEHEEARTKIKTCVKVPTTSLKVPFKTRESSIKHRLPVLRIRQGKVYPCLRKQRNPYKRKQVPKKILYTMCPETCKKKCRHNFPQVARKEMFHEFWSLKNMEEQREYIAKCVKKIAKPTCACLVASHLRGKRRGYTIFWNLNLRGSEVSVCKRFFMHVLQVSDSVVYKAIGESECITSDVVVQPCKHFTGCSKVPREPTSDGEVTEATECDVSSIDGQTARGREGLDITGSQKTREKEGLDNINKIHCVNETTGNAADNLNTCSKGENTNNSDNICYPELVQVPETSVSLSSRIVNGCQAVLADSWQIHRAQEVHPQVPHSSQSDLFHVEGNYETLSSGLNDEHPQASCQNSQVHYPAQQLAACGPYEKLRSINPAQAPVSTNINQNDSWPKCVDTFHPVFSNSHSMFPNMETSHNFSHPRDLPSHFSCPQNRTHHSYFSVQTSSSYHHPVSITHLCPDIPTSHVNFARHKDCTDGDTVTDFYHSRRFHNYTTPVVPWQGVPSSSDYPVASDQALPKSLMLHNSKNIKSDIFAPSQNKAPKVRKRKLKVNASPKLRQDMIKRQRVRKCAEKKPFSKSIKAGCMNTCKRKCGEKVSQDARTHIFTKFWSLESDTRRREYVLPIVNKVPKKTCSGVNSRRCCTVEWSIPYKGERHIVCKRFFLDTFDIGEKFVKTVFDKAERKGGSMEDLRGRHCKRSHVFVKEQEEIEKHIRSVSALKAFQCLACKKDFTCWCLAPGVIISQLYKMYADQRRKEGKKPACRTSFTDLCNKKFNLRNNTHQESLCDICSPSMESSQETSTDSSRTVRR